MFGPIGDLDLDHAEEGTHDNYHYYCSPFDCRDLMHDWRQGVPAADACLSIPRKAFSFFSFDEKVLLEEWVAAHDHLKVDTPSAISQTPSSTDIGDTVSQPPESEGFEATSSSSSSTMSALTDANSKEPLPRGMCTVM